MEAERLELFPTPFSRPKLQVQDLVLLDLEPPKTQTQHLVRAGLGQLESLKPEPPVHSATRVLVQRNLLEPLEPWDSEPLPPLPHLV